MALAHGKQIQHVAIFRHLGVQGLCGPLTLGVFATLQ
jgi:hypothetical protein